MHGSIDRTAASLEARLLAVAGSWRWLRSSARWGIVSSKLAQLEHALRVSSET